MIRNKYKCGEDLLPKINRKIRGSNVWAGIKDIWEKVVNELEMVNEGRKVRWRWEKHGTFSVKSAYEYTSHAHTPNFGSVFGN